MERCAGVGWLCGASDVAILGTRVATTPCPDLIFYPMDTQRFILFIVFALSTLMLWEAWQKAHHPSAPPEMASATAVPAAPGPAPVAQPAGSAPGVPVTAAVESAPHQRLYVRTDVLAAEIDTQGGDLVYLELLQHKDTRDNSKDLVLFGPEHRYAAQSGLTGGLPYHRTLFTAAGEKFELQPGEDKLEVHLEADAAGVKVIKTLTFHRASYKIDVTEAVTNGTAAPLSTFAYFQLTRDDKAPAGDPNMVKTYTGPALYTEQDKFRKISFSDVDKGKFAAEPSDNGWIAIVQHYFVAAWLPQEKTQRDFYTTKLADGLYSAGVKIPLGPIAPGATGQVTVPLYAGPQDQDHLKAVAPGLQLVVDYGWLTVIAVPLFWVLKLFHSWVANWGLAIIMLTIGIKLIFFPLSAASYRSMAKMKLVTPKMTKIREQYGDDKMKMNQAMMDLYKTEKINPLGGCLPILVQIPVFISLYWVLLESVELRHAPFYFWITDLSAADPWYVLPTLMMASMIIQTKLNPKPPDPVQARVMMVMPFVFGVMFYFFPAGLVLYWFINNILSILQQWQITRMIEGGKTAAGAKR
jgi:YidC/Oxa1 family membrane protein insertase